MEMDSGKDLHLGLGKRNDEGTSLGEDGNSDDGSCCPRLLPKHKIFLSHSGKQKWFVEKLCEDLEARHRFPFFDKRPSSLPKGERFPKLILEAAERCEMAVVVLSEEFLTSKWPMIELSTFVKALSGLNRGLRILPVFFGMSVSDLGSESKQGAWLKLWKEWERNDPRIISAEFEKALKVMRSFNGIVFDGDVSNVSDVWNYERDVVESICRVVGPSVKWEDSPIQGRSTLCGGAREKMKEIKPSENGIRVFGYYGVGGIGKTTMCKTLCNELSEFSGKVCHVELGGIQSVKEMLKEVLRTLTNTSEEVLQRLGEGECRSILKDRSSWRQRTFLAIDNVWDDHESMVQAKMLLQDLAFHEGSVVVLTSRCRRTLTCVGVEESHCFEVPELGEVDARKLFLHHAAGVKRFDNEEDNVVIDQCIARCWFRKSETHGHHYLPLALKVLGIHLGFVGSSPAKWLERLPEVRDFNRFEGDNPVFSIIRLSYDRLSVELQALFMDVAMFLRRNFSDLRYHWVPYLHSYFGRLSEVNRQTLQETQSQMQQLQERGLLEIVDMESQSMSMHDLYKEFAEMEAKGLLNGSSGFNDRKWVYYEGSYPSDLVRTPGGGCWENLIRLRLEMGFTRPSEIVFNFLGIEWRYFANLIVLSVRGSSEVTGVLNLEGLGCLRSLALQGFKGIDGVDGLKDLNNLVHFSWDGEGGWNRWAFLSQLSASLKTLVLKDLKVCSRSDMFDWYTNLFCLSLDSFSRARGCFDLRQCSSLRSIYLYKISGLQTLLVLSTRLQSCLQSLRIVRCEELSCVLGLGDLVHLEYLHLRRNNLLKEVPNLQKQTCLQVLFISFDQRSWKWEIAKLRGLGSLEQLREIHFKALDARELPNLNALKLLEDLTLYCWKLTLLKGVEGLTALRRVNLSGCRLLSRLPDLSNSRKLENLDICRSGIELHEVDVDMLAALPELRSVLIGYSRELRPRYIKLDPVRRKVLFQDRFRSRVVDERDLEMLPIKVCNYNL